MKNNKFDLNFLTKIGNSLSANGSTLAVIGSIITLGGAIYAAFKASKEVANVEEDYAIELANVEGKGLSVDDKASEIKRIKTVRNVSYILAYKWVILCGGSSIALMLLSKYIDGMAITGLTALAASNQEKLKKFGENAKKIIGEDKFKEIENATLEEKILGNFTTKDGEPIGFRVPFDHNGDLFVETQEGILFQMKRDELEEALTWLKDYCARNHELGKDKYFSHLGIPYDPKHKDKFEYWGPDNQFDAYIGQRTICGMTISTVEFRKNPRVRRSTR